MKFWQKVKANYKASRTIRLAYLKKFIALALLNAAYFKDSMEMATFGVLLMLLGMADHWLRLNTDKGVPHND